MGIKMYTKDKVDKFNKQGYIHLKDVIESDLLSFTRYHSIELKNHYKQFEGQPRINGTGTYWKGLEMASTLNPLLFESYTHPNMLEIAKSFLQVDEPYLFNDQVVVKLPNETFSFEPHYDNQYGPDPEAALRGEFKTINCCQILTNMTEETGPLSCFNNQTQQYDLLSANNGDIIVIDGNTLHSSTHNKSGKIRALYACVYSTHSIGNFQSGYHTQKFPHKN
jgi:ectoine hydroxylase-related dioxygenase (phytanoyl-CoA dioxygenase family)